MAQKFSRLSFLIRVCTLILTTSPEYLIDVDGAAHWDLADLYVADKSLKNTFLKNNLRS